MVRHNSYRHLAGGQGAPRLQPGNGGLVQCLECSYALPASRWICQKPHQARESHYIPGGAHANPKLLTNAATDVMEKANILSVILRAAAMDAVMLFPSLVLYPHAKGLAIRKFALK